MYRSCSSILAVVLYFSIDLFCSFSCFFLALLICVFLGLLLSFLPLMHSAIFLNAFSYLFKKVFVRPSVRHTRVGISKNGISVLSLIKIYNSDKYAELTCFVLGLEELVSPFFLSLILSCKPFFSGYICPNFPSFFRFFSHLYESWSVCRSVLRSVSKSRV